MITSRAVHPYSQRLRGSLVPRLDVHGVILPSLVGLYDDSCVKRNGKFQDALKARRIGGHLKCLVFKMNIPFLTLFRDGDNIADDDSRSSGFLNKARRDQAAKQ